MLFSKKHRQETQYLEPIFGNEAMDEAIPMYKLPKKSLIPRDVYELVRDQLIDEEQGSINIETVTDYFDEYTIGVVGILGITYTGKYDDIKSLDKKVEEYNKCTKYKVYIHVDAASRGVFAQFVEPELNWDFRLKNVHSISASGHKYGLIYPGVGWVIWK